MFQDRHNRKSGATAEQTKEYFFNDDPNYEGPKLQMGWADSQARSVLSKESRLTRSKVFQVRAMTRAGGNPFKIILGVSNADDQYKLEMQKCKVMGVDRPTVRPWHSVTSQETSDMIADYASGMRVKDICEKYHVSDSVVYHNGVISRKVPEHSEEFKDEIIKMYDSGMTACKIAETLEVNPNVTRRIIMKSKKLDRLTSRHFVRLTQEDTNKILKFFNCGMIIGHIAKYTGHSKSTIERIVGHVPSKSYKKNDKNILDEIHTCWTLGESLSATARKLNRPKSTVKFHFDKFKKEVSK
jgi:transposase-like protein